MIVTGEGGDYVSPHLSKDEDIRVEAGVTVTVRTPGGGYGDPWQRDPALGARDVARGYFSADDARCDYGVVVSGDPPVVDRGATEELRHHR